MIVKGAFAPPRGRRPSIEWVPPEELMIDRSYQRSIDSPSARRLIVAIAESWNWDLCMTLAVSRRPDDSLWIMDGQHRHAAARLRGDIDSLPCNITRRSGPEEEAYVFIAANRSRRTVTTLDDFHAALAAGDPEALTLDRLVRGAGLQVARHSNAQALGPGEIAHIKGLRRALSRYGEQVVGAALTSIGEAFPDEVLVNPGALLSALIAIHARPPIRFDPDLLFETLLDGTTEDWSGRAGLHLLRGGKQREDALRETILTAYHGRQFERAVA